MELGWLAVEDWVVPYLPRLGFAHTNNMDVYRLSQWDTLPAPNPTVRLRPATLDDFPTLIALEERAMAPLLATQFGEFA